MVDTQSALYKFYRRLVRSNNYSDIQIPPAEAHYVSTAIFDRTGEKYGAEWVWISMWLEGVVNPDEISKIPEWYLEKYMGGVSPNIVELKAKLWLKYKQYVLKEKGIDIPF